MGFQDVVRRQYFLRSHYKRLHGGNDDERQWKEEGVMMRRRRWVRKVNGKAAYAVRLSCSKRLNWRSFSLILMPRRLARIYAEIAGWIMKMDVGAHPAIVFSSQWGLPVLSHASIARRSLHTPQRKGPSPSQGDAWGIVV